MNPPGPILLLLVGSLALVTSVMLTPLVRAAALRWTPLSVATPERWHQRPTPSFGGIAIFLGFAVALVAEMLLSTGDLSIREVSPSAVVPLTHRDGLLAAAVMIFALGLVDDLVQLRPSAKLIGQLAAASVLLMSGIGVWLTGSYLVLCSQSLFRFADLGDDGLCRGGPDKGCGVIVSAIDVVVDRLD